MTSTDLVPVQQHASAGDLAEIANREHTLTLEAARSALEHAIQAGRALAEARALIGVGDGLKALGYPVTRIAAILGVRLSTAQGYLDPATAAARRERARRKRIAAGKALQREQREQEIRRRATAAGGSIAALYADAERMQDTIASARSEATSRQARSALDTAGEHYRQMRDCVVRALGVA